MLSAFLPDLGVATQALIRSAYGVLMIATLLQALPEARRFFLSERWGGYANSQPDVDLIQNPFVMPALFAAWMAAALSLVAGWWMPWAAVVNLVLCRYFFIHMRWKGVLRGMGAPGFIAYWLGAVVTLLEVTRRFAPSVLPMALLVAQVDFAFLMFSAGFYKLTAGYPRNHGMELGLCNPMWGYWWRSYVKRAPSSPVFWVMNQLAWTTEVVAALLMFVPATRELGAVLIIVSFIFIATQIRLGFLTEMVIVCSVIFLSPAHIIGRWLESVLGGAVPPPVMPIAPLATVLTAALWAYLVLLPLAGAGLYSNFYARRALPPLLQTALERYTNFFGIILWRVFSVDLVNFFIRMSRVRGAERIPIGPLGAWPRFNHVGEMICLTSLFTTLKYYPSNNQLFQERLFRYARTLPREPGERLVFEYVSVVKQADRFDWVSVGEFEVDLEARQITERWFDRSISPRAAHQTSPVHEGVVPGSYRPVAS
jgi:hypothetical protein